MNKSQIDDYCQQIARDLLKGNGPDQGVMAKLIGELCEEFQKEGAEAFNSKTTLAGNK